MADQSSFNHRGLEFNFQGQPYLDIIADYTDSFEFPEFDAPTASELWVENPPPMLHDPTSSVMGLFLGNDLWMETDLFSHRPNSSDESISNDLNVTLSYNMGHQPESHTNSSTSGLVTTLAPPESSISPTQVEDKLRSPLPSMSKRRRIEDYQIEFMGPEPVQTEKRRRQPYKTPERRMAVGKIRALGACVRCKIMKTPV